MVSSWDRIPGETELLALSTSMAFILSVLNFYNYLPTTFSGSLSVL